MSKIIANAEITVGNDGNWYVYINGNEVNCSSATLWLDKGEVPQLDITVPVDKFTFCDHVVVDTMEDDLK